MTFEHVNQLLGDIAHGCDGDGTKLVKNHQTDTIYVVSISCNDGDVSVRELPDTPENWAKISAHYNEAIKTEDPYYGSDAKMRDALDAHSVRVISTSFWG